jgi:acetolactate synthase-1/2/3 large subunit
MADFGSYPSGAPGSAFHEWDAVSKRRYNVSQGGGAAAPAANDYNAVAAAPAPAPAAAPTSSYGGAAPGYDPITEAIRNSPAVVNHIPRTQALSWIGGAGGGLGYSAGMALGVKLAQPDRRVVHIVGDGGFHFSTPTSVYATAQRYQLPILTVVLDNGGWQAVKEAVLRVYPDGEAAQANEFQARLPGQQRHFEQVAQAFGGYGECVSDPADVPPAIARCLQALQDGRAAVLNVQIGLQ